MIRVYVRKIYFSKAVVPPPYYVCIRTSLAFRVVHCGIYISWIRRSRLKEGRGSDRTTCFNLFEDILPVWCCCCRTTVLWCVLKVFPVVAYRVFTENIIWLLIIPHSKECSRYTYNSQYVYFMFYGLRETVRVEDLPHDTRQHNMTTWQPFS